MEKAEVAELRRFWKRRQVFGGSLPVQNVHNVPDYFPLMFTNLYHAEPIPTGLFSGPAYSDFDSKTAEEYERWLSDNMEGKTISLKILPEYFEAQIEGKKNFEIRKNDRDYRVGSVLSLREFDGHNYTGRGVKVVVTFITDYAQRDGYIVLGTQPFERGRS